MDLTTRRRTDGAFWQRYQEFLKNQIFSTIAACFESERVEVDAWYRTVKIEGLYGNRNGIGKPEDKDVTLIAFKRGSDVVGAIVNISCHPTVLGAQNMQISSDLLGYISRGVKEQLGVYPLMMQGASGDMSNRNYRQGHDAKELARTGEGILAQLFAKDDLATDTDWHNGSQIEDEEEKVEEQASFGTFPQNDDKDDEYDTPSFLRRKFGKKKK